LGRVWVVNASPLILLGRIGQIELLQKLCTELIIPAGVAQEIEQGTAEDTARIWVQEHGHTNVQAVDAVDPTVAGWDLGLGESHVLHLCYRQPGRDAILDDLAARNCAAALGVPVRGTLAVIVLAKRRGIIAAARPLLQGLVARGLRIDRPVFERALRLANE